MNLSDDDINEVIGDGTCTHLPQVRMALEIREHRAATTAVALSADDRAEMTSLLEHLDEQRLASIDEGRSGDFEAFTCWQAALGRLLATGAAR